MSIDSDLLYEKMGQEQGLRKLVNDFYDFMDHLPEVADIRQQHASDLTEAREKLFMFLSGWSGGPSLYIEKFGHPRLRARHLPFAIGIKERDQWLYCMFKALDKSDYSETTKLELKKSFAHIADFMRNKDEN